MAGEYNETPHSEDGPIKTVSNLTEYKFYVPSYQRGYRWTKQEVEDLLEDIASFTPREVSGDGRTTWYCLQPLIVRKRQNDSNYEVIDGQQRLTTILLIGKYINEMWRGREKDPEISLTYESREKTAEFFRSLCVGADGVVEINKDNIDFFHISTAYKTISEWFGGCKSFKRDTFISSFLHHIKVIWYEPTEADSIKIFTRINMGKIPLTNAELIKALFLNSSNFASSNASGVEQEKVRLHQLEIARDWDRMEAALHNPEFWYFLSDQEDLIETRVDIIFGLLTGDYVESGPYGIFRAYSAQFKRSPLVEIESNWAQVKRCFQTLEEWFNDRELYHKIGYLICIGANLSELYNSSIEPRKSEFMKLLNERIAEAIPDEIESLEFGDKQVRHVLLLHNIQTMLNNEKERSRFPFDRYKGERWDVEHVHSVSEKKPQSEKHQREWLTEAVQYCSEKELVANVNALLNRGTWDNDCFLELYTEMLGFYAENNKDDLNINDISNLVLLDARTNRGYGNAVFPEKRKFIIEREMCGVFIPVCTKNVFMKFYGTKVDNFTFWSRTDRDAYVSNITKVLMVYKPV